MRVLVTGNRGYIGSVLTGLLAKRGHEVVGYDIGYYDGAELYPVLEPAQQIRKDIRDVSAEDLQGIHGVIHLAALSNDPLGELTPGITEEINFKATIKLATLAKAVGVRRFVYASSQSMYGVADTSHELTEDEAGAYGITAYAKTKWAAECELKKMCGKSFEVVCLRPSTVFGASPNFRSDIVFNNFMAAAYTAGRIEVKSDGTPWRPVVHIRDACQAFLAGLEAPKALVNCESFNVGIPNGNFTVRELAEAAQRAVPGSTLVFTGEHGKDARTYRVSFEKILTSLRDYYKPEWDLDAGGKELVAFFKKVHFALEDFRGGRTNRLKHIRELIKEGTIDETLRRRT
jgi:nucleoside-diphosphate-sugar epimerase